MRNNLYSITWFAWRLHNISVYKKKSEPEPESLSEPTICGGCDGRGGRGVRGGRGGRGRGYCGGG